MSNRFGYDPPWLRSVKRMEDLFREPTWLRSFNEANSQINQISIRISEAAKPMLEMQDKLKDILGNHQLLLSLDRTAQLQKDLFANTDLIRTAQELTAWCNDNVMLLRSIKTLMPVISDTSFMRSITDAQSHFTEMVRGFDLNSLSYGDDTLIYEGQEYTSNDLTAELSDEITLVETHKTFPERFEGLKEKFWLIVLIIRLLTIAPDIEDKAKWYVEKIETVVSRLSSQDVYEETFAYVIRDSAILRESAESKSPQIVRLLYDTKLRVISEVPRWVQVEYTDAEGNSLIGWISKISVTTEDDS